ncbi:hypothetical protein DQ384_40000 [Sphaerisporangium album]|uniref:Uncharacterized protein n=1 Tax=Sphaerisporangium album TaxID=509200 RepID=A0A367EGM9_9ACTN|nr:hypothetical protein DQ384_40000 [Sphaerisporangium album]
MPEGARSGGRVHADFGVDGPELLALQAEALDAAYREVAGRLPADHVVQLRRARRPQRDLRPLPQGGD